VAKNIAVTERYRLRFETEFFNIASAPPAKAADLSLQPCDSPQHTVGCVRRLLLVAGTMIN
jgi:hypothetical protein